MTLILSTLTPDFVIQISDRRVTKGSQIVDNDATKAVLFRARTSFAFTGLAYLPKSAKVSNGYPVEKEGVEELGVRANLWLADVLRLGTNLMECLRIVQEEASAAISKSIKRYSPESCRLAFIGVGWLNQEGKLIPVLHEISNLGQPPERIEEFCMKTLAMPKDQTRFTYFSKELNSGLKERLDTAIASCVRNDALPGTIGRLLRQALRSHAKGDRTVGEAVLQTCLPRAMVETALAGKNYFISGDAPNLEHMTFSLIPEGREDGIPNGPTIVMRDGTTFSGMELTPGSPVMVDQESRPTPPTDTSSA